VNVKVIIERKCMSTHSPSVLKTMCQVSPGASSPVIFVLRRHLPMYGVFGLNLFTTIPSSCFFDIFSTLTGAGASVATSALTVNLPLMETLFNETWEINITSYHTHNHILNNYTSDRSVSLCH